MIILLKIIGALMILVPYVIWTVAVFTDERARETEPLWFLITLFGWISLSGYLLFIL